VGLYRYTDEVMVKEDKKEDDKRECRPEVHCDAESARALKKILSLIDDLNNRDLQLLAEVVDRLLCLRSKDS